MIPDGIDQLMGERIGDVLNECAHRKKQHYEVEQNFWTAWKKEPGAGHDVTGRHAGMDVPGFKNSILRWH